MKPGCNFKHWVRIQNNSGQKEKRGKKGMNSKFGEICMLLYDIR